MIEWHDPKTTLPKDKQDCLLLAEGSFSYRTYGPIMWHGGSGAWLDLFATPEAGTVISPDQVYRWTDWDEIAPKEDET
jgi:hypothetical protein